MYTTGRTLSNLEECAAEIKVGLEVPVEEDPLHSYCHCHAQARGGHPIPIQMDHGIDSEVSLGNLLLLNTDLTLTQTPV